jgi:uncharacterized protein YndB with AHSA1/START domain
LGPAHTNAEDGGPIIEALPNQRFVFQWQPGESPSTVAFELEPRGAGTVVYVTESGYSSWIGLIGCATGWGEALTLLKFYLEYGLTYGAVPAAPESFFSK